ncbi:NADH-quinone oxidoreductase subunit C [Chloroflexota bacterium]
MTVSLAASEVAGKVTGCLPESAVEVGGEALLVKGESLLGVAEYLKNDPELDFDYLTSVTAVDYYDYFELVYHLVSLKHNHSLVLKARCYDRENPAVPSVVGLWQGADFQEREIYDLMGISFTGHPNLKRIFLWQGFAGHPLRKDYL